MTDVSAGIITRSDGKILICKRGPGRKNAHLWEFPGGKQEPGETPESCLARELQEELSLPVRDIRRAGSTEAGEIRLNFLLCSTDKEPVKTEHEEIRWVSPHQMLGLDFCLGDKKTALRLALSDIPPRAFMWDFDGTVADSYPMMADILCRITATYGCELSLTDSMALLKKSLGEALEAAAPLCGTDAGTLRKDFLTMRQEIEPESLRAMPGIREALEALQGPHFLVTHRDSGVWNLLERMDLREYFSGGVTGDMGFPRKPAPDGIRWLLEQEHLEPPRTMMIGDRPIDVQAGRTAGLITCLLDTEHRFEDEPCDAVCRYLWQIPDLLKPLSCD